MWEVTIEKHKWDDKKGFILVSSSRIHFIKTKEHLNDILSGISYINHFVKVNVIYREN